MNKSFKDHVINILSFVILIIGIGLAVFGLRNRSSSKTDEITEVSITNKFGTIAELSTFEYSYTMIETLENAKEIFDIDIPFTTKKIVIIGEGKIKLRFDFDGVRPKVDKEKHEIYIKIPEVEVLDNYLEILKCIEENNIFNPISTEDSQKLVDKERKKRLKEAEEKGAFEKAREKAKTAIETMYADIDDYEIVVE